MAKAIVKNKSKSTSAKSTSAKSASAKSASAKSRTRPTTSSSKSNVKKSPVAKATGSQSSPAKSGATKSARVKSTVAKASPRHAADDRVAADTASTKKNSASKLRTEVSAVTKKSITAARPLLPENTSQAPAKPVKHFPERQPRGMTMTVTITDSYKPTESESYMNPKQLEYFRRKLLSWKQSLLEESTETLHHLKEENWNEPDITDRATIETDTALELRTRDRYRKLIGKIDMALRRIETGEFGYCEVSGEPIGIKRLEARPIATMTIAAQEQHEREEELYADDDEER